MNNQLIDAFFYVKPKLPKDKSHKISFYNENDEYNPYSLYNKYAQCSFYNEKIIDFIFKDLISIDLNNFEDIDKLNVYSQNFNLFCLSELQKIMNENNIEFKKISQYFAQTMFIKFSFLVNFKEIDLFFQCYGTSFKKQIIMNGMYVIQMCINKKHIWKIPKPYPKIKDIAI